MGSIQDLIYDWEDEAGFHRPPQPMSPGDELAEFRLALIEEEFQELREAIDQQDTVNLAKELADLVWVTYAAARAVGIDLDKVIHEVGKSNFSKFTGGIEREGNKIVKGDQYVPPRLDDLLFEMERDMDDEQ